MHPRLSEILKIPISERMEWVEAIWNSIAQEKSGQAYSLSQEQITILEDELAAYHKNPDEGSEWEDVKKRIIGE